MTQKALWRAGQRAHSGQVNGELDADEKPGRRLGAPSWVKHVLPPTGFSVHVVSFGWTVLKQPPAGPHTVLTSDVSADVVTPPG